jgi:hypothetical protein
MEFSEIALGFVSVRTVLVVQRGVVHLGPMPPSPLPLALFTEVPRRRGVLESSLPLVHAHRTQRYTLWIGQLVAQIAL